MHGSRKANHQSKSARVQITNEVEDCIQELAQQFGCFYNNKASLSLILKKIASRELEVRERSSRSIFQYSEVGDKTNSESAFAVLTFTTYKNLRGVLSIASHRISRFQGDVKKIDVLFVDEYAHIRLLVKIPRHTTPDRDFIVSAMRDLAELKVSDVGPKNSEADFHRVSEEYGLEASSFKDRKLITYISCSFWVEIVAEDQVGVLADVTEEIAGTMLLDDIKLITEYSDKYGKMMTYIQILVNLFRGSNTLDVPIEDITLNQGILDSAIASISKFPSIREIGRIGINSRQLLGDIIPNPTVRDSLRKS